MASQGNPSRIATLPPSCRPCSVVHFIASGARDGNYHLVAVHPSNELGGDVSWCDSKFQCVDQVSLSGVMFEVAADALEHALEDRSWTENRRQFVVREFQQRVISRCGNLLAAWRTVFDKDQTDFLNFTHFLEGCKVVGYRGCPFRLWDMLDADRSGEICLKEFTEDVGDPLPKGICNFHSNASPDQKGTCSQEGMRKSD